MQALLRSTMWSLLALNRVHGNCLRGSLLGMLTGTYPITSALWWFALLARHVPTMQGSFDYQTFALGNGSLPSAVSFTTESAKHTATYLTRRVLIWQLVRRSLTASSRYGTKLRVRQLSEFLRTGSALYSAVDAEAVARTGCCIRCAEWKAFSEWCESLARR